jgi:hypothetical protein
MSRCDICGTFADIVSVCADDLEFAGWDAFETAGAEFLKWVSECHYGSDTTNGCRAEFGDCTVNEQGTLTVLHIS